MKQLIALVITISFLSIGIVAVADNGPTDVILENNYGNVSFNHVQHQSTITDCATCHHKGVDQGSCSSCHDGTNAPTAKKAFHSLCKDCHKKSESEKVSGQCSECHTK